MALLSPISHIKLLGVRIDRLTSAEAVNFIIQSLSQGGGWLVSHNLDTLRQAVHDPDCGAFCREATLCLADGMPLVWASRLQGTPLPQRVAGSDLIWELTAQAASHGKTVFFLGGKPGVAQAAAMRLQKENPLLCVAGVECPPFGFEHDRAYIERLKNVLMRASPDICYVALGFPKQERLVQILRPVLPRCWFLGLGASINFVSGDIRRAPMWMRRIGLEWLHRLIHEPRRLMARYLIRDLPFAARLLLTSAMRRLFA